MALGTVRAPDIDRALTMYGPFGNVSYKLGTITLPAAAAIGTKIDFMRLPRGVRLIDAMLIGRSATATSVTMEVGIAQIPGFADEKVDADALIKASSVAAAAITRRNNAAVKPSDLELDDDYLIQGVTAGAANGAAATIFDLFVYYEVLGTS